MRRTACANCGDSLVKFLDLGSSPLADRFPAAAGTPEQFYPLELAVCETCWLVQMLEVVPGMELYGDDYAFHTGASPSLKRYFADVAAQCISFAPQHVTEIACNDGTLLSHFAEAGCTTLGIDPSGPAEAARERGLDVLRVPFTAAVAGEHAGKSDLVLAFNVAAHVEDPHDFFEGIRLLLAPGGIAVIEFQYLGDLIAGCMIDHVYHEHRFFYSKSSFASLISHHGLHVTECEHTAGQGGSLRVTLSKDTGSAWPGEDWLSQAQPYQGLQKRADYMKASLLDLINDADGVVAGYGATAKSATLLNWCGITPAQVKWVEDVTPGKIGKFTPGTKIPVQAPGTHPDVFVLLAWNYLSHVIRRERAFLDGGGTFIVPGPVPCVL
jgi:SAM-dependent methyltransferase